MALDQWVQIIIAIATLGAVIAAIYNARIAMAIATREKRHEVRVVPESGLLLETKPDGSGGSYIRTQSDSRTYKNIKSISNPTPVLEIRINNIGELPVRVEGIFIAVLDDIIHLNALETIFKAELIFHTIGVGMTDVQFYEFERIVQGERIKSLHHALCNNLPITLCVQTNFQKIFSAALPKDFILYIQGIPNENDSPADA